MRLTDATERIGTHEFPATTDELVDQFGDLELTHPTGTETLSEVLNRLDEETFESAEEAQHTLYSAVGSEAIGREGYSDRDPAVPGAEGHDPMSI